MQGLFITGTDTNVGKTHVATGIIAALRAQEMRVGAYKPVVTGCERGPHGPVWSDLERLYDALGGEFARERICPQKFDAPLAPPVAARFEKKTIDAAVLRSGIDWWRERVDFLVVEGAGGLLSPLTESECIADLAVSFALPLLIVSRLSLGTINHTLLTVEAARSRNLTIAGIVLNQPTAAGEDASVASNPDELRRRCPAPILATVPYETTAGLLRHSPLFTIDWMKLSQSR